MRPWICLSALLLVAACDDGTGPLPTDNRYYEYTLTGCDDTDPLVNCAPSLELCSDGSAVMLVTDIINDGTYSESGGVVTASFGAGDVPDTIVFEPAATGDAIVDDWIGEEWQLATTQFSACPQ